MTRKLTFIIICLTISVLIIPKNALGLIVPPDIGTGPGVPIDESVVPCTGPWWARIACIADDIRRYMLTIRRLTNALDYLPHQFPFGGPILSSEQACGFHLRITVWTGWILPVVGWVPIPAPIPITVPLTGRAIRVGNPVPVVPPITPPFGRVIAFPWISKIYDQHTENRAGPWALGLGFTPFPLRDINASFEGLRIWIPPTLLDRDCLVPSFEWYGETGYIATCIDHISFECLDSGEIDDSGFEVYKVIRLLGTSGDNAPASAFPPGFPLPF